MILGQNGVGYPPLRRLLSFRPKFSGTVSTESFPHNGQLARAGCPPSAPRSKNCEPSLSGIKFSNLILLQILAHPTRFERVAFAFGGQFFIKIVVIKQYINLI